MTELNPYEPPQSDLNSTPREKGFSSTAWQPSLRIIERVLIGLQVAAAVMYCVFDIMQEMGHSNYQQLQAAAGMVGVAFIILTLLLIIVAGIRDSIALLIIECLLLMAIIMMPARIA
jgi:hypothetical protein